MPINCMDFRKIGKDRIEHVWNIVQQGSFLFPEGKELRQSFTKTLVASWSWNKCKLEREKFNEKSINEALNSSPTIIPREPDKLELFKATHKPKRLETILNVAATLVCYLFLFLTFFFIFSPKLETSFAHFCSFPIHCYIISFHLIIWFLDMPNFMTLNDLNLNVVIETWRQVGEGEQIHRFFLRFGLMLCNFLSLILSFSLVK
ncbi:hypothetical protein Cgig2_010028 [Carnegiea gigantea]|uniref:Uncharacterized protein n=1 Tax=Carnegiea gigantea TaxID=171969 RepID=A0A9Q1K3N0_9CARY|nr:hypothetical protein Cgig2_010028 [Carnegiea gigantea]